MVQSHIPFFECPDADLVTTTTTDGTITNHLTYGSPNSGYSFTEFHRLPRWSGHLWRHQLSGGHHFMSALDTRSTYSHDYARTVSHARRKPRKGTSLATASAANIVQPPRAGKTCAPTLKKTTNLGKTQFVLKRDCSAKRPDYAGFQHNTLSILRDGDGSICNRSKRLLRPLAAAERVASKGHHLETAHCFHSKDMPARRHGTHIWKD